MHINVNCKLMELHWFDGCFYYCSRIISSFHPHLVLSRSSISALPHAKVSLQVSSYVALCCLSLLASRSPLLLLLRPSTILPSTLPIRMLPFTPSVTLPSRMHRGALLHFLLILLTLHPRFPSFPWCWWVLTLMSSRASLWASRQGLTHSLVFST